MKTSLLCLRASLLLLVVMLAATARPAVSSNTRRELLDKHYTSVLGQSGLPQVSQPELIRLLQALDTNAVGCVGRQLELPGLPNLASVCQVLSELFCMNLPVQATCHLMWLDYVYGVYPGVDDAVCHALADNIIKAFPGSSAVPWRQTCFAGPCVLALNGDVCRVVAGSLTTCRCDTFNTCLKQPGIWGAEACNPKHKCNVWNDRECGKQFLPQGYGKGPCRCLDAGGFDTNCILRAQNYPC